VYGPKLLATRKPFGDLALESRCLTTVGKQNVQPIPLFRMNRFMLEAQQLRNKLILWRFRNYGEIKQKAAQLEEKGLADKVYDGAKGISSRIKQVILPLWLLSKGSEMKVTLTNLAKAYDRKMKLEDPDYLLELQAKEAVTIIVDDYEKLSEKDRVSEKLVNIVYIVNDIGKASKNKDTKKKMLYNIALSKISKTILQGILDVDESNITASNIGAKSKDLKRVFQTRLGFTISIGKKRRRIVHVPVEWIKSTSTPQGRLT
jgi:hypothetical protein